MTLTVPKLLVMAGQGILAVSMWILLVRGYDTMIERMANPGIRRIVLEVIPDSQQRYATLGDWQYNRQGTLRIRVSDTGNPAFNTLLEIHEFVEATLCQAHGVTEIAVDDFDFQYEKDRLVGKVPPDGEPGDDPRAPYFKEHQAATKVERLMSQILGVTWKEYNDKLAQM